MNQAEADLAAGQTANQVIQRRGIVGERNQRRLRMLGAERDRRKNTPAFEIIRRNGLDTEETSALEEADEPTEVRETLVAGYDHDRAAGFTVEIAISRQAGTNQKFTNILRERARFHAALEAIDTGAIKTVDEAININPLTYQPYIRLLQERAGIRPVLTAIDNGMAPWQANNVTHDANYDPFYDSFERFRYRAAEYHIRNRRMTRDEAIARFQVGELFYLVRLRRLSDLIAAQDAVDTGMPIDEAIAMLTEQHPDDITALRQWADARAARQNAPAAVGAGSDETAPDTGALSESNLAASPSPQTAPAESPEGGDNTETRDPVVTDGDQTQIDRFKAQLSNFVERPIPIPPALYDRIQSFIDSSQQAAKQDAELQKSLNELKADLAKVKLPEDVVVREAPPPPDVGNDNRITDTELRAAISGGNINGIYDHHLRNAIGNDQWRHHADDILPILGERPPYYLTANEMNRRREITSAIVGALLQNEAWTSVERTVEQSGRLIGAMLLAAMLNTTPILEEQSASVMALGTRVGNDAAAREEAQEFVSLLYPEINRLDRDRLSSGANNTKGFLITTLNLGVLNKTRAEEFVRGGGSAPEAILTFNIGREEDRRRLRILGSDYDFDHSVPAFRSIERHGVEDARDQETILGNGYDRDIIAGFSEQEAIARQAGKDSDFAAILMRRIDFHKAERAVEGGWETKDAMSFYNVTHPDHKQAMDQTDRLMRALEEVDGGALPDAAIADNDVIFHHYRVRIYERYAFRRAKHDVSNGLRTVDDALAHYDITDPEYTASLRGLHAREAAALAEARAAFTAFEGHRQRSRSESSTSSY